MRRRSLFLLVFAFLCALGSPAAGQNDAPDPGEVPTVEVVKVNGALDRVLTDFLLGELADAEASGSTLVLQLDSSGTLDVEALALAQRIHEAEVPVVVWNGDVPSSVRGGALLLMAASSLSAVSPGSATGPLEPLDLARPERVVEDADGIVRRWYADFGKGEAPALTGLTGAVPGQDALDLNLAQEAAPSIPALLEVIDGLEVGTAAGPVTLETALAQEEGVDEPVLWTFRDLGPFGRVLHAMISPSAIYLLLCLGLAGVAFEVTQPGFGFAGFAGLGSLALAIYGLFLVPFNPLGLVVLLAGVALLVLDVQLRSLGWRTWSGLAVFVLGSLLVFGGVSDLIDLSPWLIGSMTVASVLYYGFALTVAIQSRDRISTQQRGLIGLVGEARNDLNPVGGVYVKGTMWRGKAIEGEIPQGTRVRVRRVDGLVLAVEPVADDASDLETDVTGPDGQPSPAGA
ncbi:MAG: NfeD family protein [Actinomycetota bacterium]